MSETFVFHKLKVWQEAKGLVKDIYQATRCFPAEEKFGLASQINRAAVSIASNIAEGSGRISRKDQAHFSQIAYGSLMEVACQLEIARDLGLIKEEELVVLHRTIKKVAEKLSALRSSQLSTLNSQQGN